MFFELMRHSHCIVCHTRLSWKDRAGRVLWHEYQDSADGKICHACYMLILKADEKKKVAEI